MAAFTRKCANGVIKSGLITNLLEHRVCAPPLTAFYSSYKSNSENSNGENKNSKWKVAICVTGALGAYITHKSRSNHVSAARYDPSSPFRGAGNTGSNTRRGAFNFIADVVQVAGPAVVHIERLVNVPFTRKAIAVSNGSGFIVDSNGLIVTNAHVVGNQSALKVKLQDGREFEGQVIGIDEARDIAAVKVNCTQLPQIPLGTTRDLRPGEWVVAIGSPLALQNTVTAGIVSNMCRGGKELGLRDEEKRDMEYIQTDATINVGNSGGPLVNLDGQVIGVNSMMASAGIGFAIPIDYVREFLQQLEHGQQTRVRHSRRWIGINMLSITPDIASHLRSRNPDFPDVTSGVYVHKVQYESPSYMAGVQDGDVITDINGQPIQGVGDVLEALKHSQVLNAKIRRKSRTIVIRIVAEEIVH
uniref:Serine protease HTRA2, mitochondrial n=1 Tax=Ciona savignyi TaxID=51511 RepID=H2Z5M8_CIOSA